MRASASRSTSTPAAWGRAFPALALCGGLLSACNAIFGITEAQPTGTGGASSASGPGGQETSSTGGPAPVCDGTGPIGPIETKATFSRQSSAYGVEVATAVAIGADASIYVTGTYTTDDVYFGAAPLPYDANDGDNVFVLKLNPGGQIDWAAGFKGPLDQQPLGLALDESGHVLITGRMEGSLDLGATTLKASGLDAFVAQLDAATGKVGWAKRFGGAGDELGQQIAADGKGHLVLTGTTNGAIDFGCAKPIDAVPTGLFLVQLDAADGKCVWQHKYLVNTSFADKNSAGSPVALAVDRSGAGAVYVVGGANSPNFGQGPIAGLGGDDVFILKTSAAGDYVNARIFGAQSPDDDGVQYASSVAVDPCGNVVLTGSFTHDLTFGQTPTLHTKVANNDAGISDVNDEDIFVAKLDASLTPLWARSFGDVAEQHGASVVVDAFSNITFAGTVEDLPYSTGIDFGGSILHGSGPGDGGKYNGEIVVAQLDAKGKSQWARRYGTPAGQVVTGVASDDAGHTVFVGTFLTENQAPFAVGSGVPPLLALYFDALIVGLGP